MAAREAEEAAAHEAAERAAQAKAMEEEDKEAAIARSLKVRRRVGLGG